MTPLEIQLTINALESEVQTLRALANDKTTLHYALTAAMARRAPQDEIDTLHSKLAAATEATATLSLKQGAINLLKDQLADANANQRRATCKETEATFDQLKVEYEQKAQDLLHTFRNLHRIHLDYLSLTSRPLLHEPDYALNLPSTRGKFDSPAFATGAIVRMGQ